MKRHLTILTIFYILSSCSKVNKHSDKIRLSNNGDTIEVIKYYPSDSIREIIYYNNNRPKSNIGLYQNGDTIKRLDVTYSKEDSLLFAFIPISNNKTYDILIGIDSGATEEKIDRLYDVTKKLKNLKSSISFRVPFEFFSDSLLKGVFKCNNDSGKQRTYTYHPFIVRKTNYR